MVSRSPSDDADPQAVACPGHPDVQLPPTQLPRLPRCVVLWWLTVTDLVGEHVRQEYLLELQALGALDGPDLDRVDRSAVIVLEQDDVVTGGTQLVGHSRDGAATP